MDRIGRDFPEAALAWFDGLNQAVVRLEQFPYSGRVLPELPLSDRREIAYRGFRVIYRVKPGEVFILRVVHSRRDVTPRDRELILEPD